MFFDKLPPIFGEALAQTLPLISANAKTNKRLHDLNGTYDINSAFDPCHLLPAGTPQRGQRAFTASSRMR